MSRELWWARLSSSSPRYADWFTILGTDKVPLRCPVEGETEFLGEGKVQAHTLKIEELDEEQFARLVAFVVKKFGAPPAEVQEEIRKNGFPIRAEDVAVFFDTRAFL